MLKFAEIVCECGHTNRLGHLDVSGILCAGCQSELPIGEPVGPSLIDGLIALARAAEAAQADVVSSGGTQEALRLAAQAEAALAEARADLLL